MFDFRDHISSKLIPKSWGSQIINKFGVLDPNNQFLLKLKMPFANPKVPNNLGATKAVITTNSKLNAECSREPSKKKSLLCCLFPAYGKKYARLDDFEVDGGGSEEKAEETLSISNSLTETDDSTVSRNRGAGGGEEAEGKSAATYHGLSNPAGKKENVTGREKMSLLWGENCHDEFPYVSTLERLRKKYKIGDAWYNDFYKVGFLSYMGSLIVGTLIYLVDNGWFRNPQIN